MQQKMKQMFRLRQVSRNSEILALAAKIKEDYPYCISMYNHLLLNARGHNRCFQNRYYVPADFPDSHIVIWVRMTEPRDMGVHCNKKETSLLTRIAQSDDFLSLMNEAPGILSHLPDYLVRPLSETIEEILQETLQFFPGWTLTYVAQQSYPLRCPDGFRVKRLNKAGIQHLLQMSPFNKDDSPDLTVKLTKSLPALGFYVDPSCKGENIINLEKLEFSESKEIPVSWVGMYHYGPFGMSGTHEDYKGHGFKSILCEMMGRILIKDGYFPHGYVEHDTAAVLKMLENIPGWNNTHCATWFKY